MKKAQEKEWNSLAKEWNSFLFTCLGISYHISSWQDIYECAGKCLGFIIKVVGTTQTDDFIPVVLNGKNKGIYWHTPMDYSQSLLMMIWTEFCLIPS